MGKISILNQLIGDDQGDYRIRIGKHVGYLTIDADVFDEDTMCPPYLLIPKLPPIPEGGWTRMKIKRAETGVHSDSHIDHFDITTTNDPLPEVETLFHPQQIDILSLEQAGAKWHKSAVHKVMYNNTPAISEYAAF